MGHPGEAAVNRTGDTTDGILRRMASSARSGIFTPKQGQYLAFIYAYMRVHGTAESAFRAGVTVGGCGRAEKTFEEPRQMAEESAAR